MIVLLYVRFVSVYFEAHPGFRGDGVESRLMYSSNDYKLKMPSSSDCRCIAPASPIHLGSVFALMDGS